MIEAPEVEISTLVSYNKDRRRYECLVAKGDLVADAFYVTEDLIDARAASRLLSIVIERSVRATEALLKDTKGLR